MTIKEKKTSALSRKTKGGGILGMNGRESTKGPQIQWVWMKGISGIRTSGNNKDIFA